MTRIKTVGFVGLGVMGSPMARHALQAGYDVVVFNRTTEKAKAWVEQFGGAYSDDLPSMAERCDVVLTCVGADRDLEEVYLGEFGLLSGNVSQTFFVDHTTASAEIARQLFQSAKSRGAAFLDAPVSGGQAGAERGQLTVMVGGDESAFDIVKPVLEAFSRAVTYMGESGSGQLCKMVNQIAIAGVLEGLAEALNFSESAGLDTKTVLEVISKGAAQSWQMENRGSTMVEGKYDFGFAVDWMRKDLGLVLDEAREKGVSLPLVALVDQFYGEVQKKGGGRWDTSSLLTRYVSR
ncbi:NAD(P)-dependent oxidoreductase [Marinibactrum halimedae]|uniref:Oxidoreductase n=1 Tax=Marinibactrum halimedae TaxID=1444977 RepID=A0AA37WMP9_9GAMM|nr:NAD(P)-dependent oxidoreductase [Marinibactrum halimedae]MCD9458523.1 NAD(P)-dependent oxidoreductase [Marinibactrum halimedae]GLS26613.1 oxidoreductase [Marinibactrum halimedae]